MSAAESDPGCGLYPVVQAAKDPAVLARLEALIKSCSWGPAGLGSVLIKPAPETLLEARTVLPMVEALQSADIAAILLDDADLVRIVKADGMHLGWSQDIGERYENARDILGTRHIIGADVGRSRHDAMSIGEKAADYVAFGVPAHVEDRETALRRQIELVDWWAEIFEVPCVACDVDGLEAMRALAAAGADYVALDLPTGLAGADLVATVDDAVGAVDIALSATPRRQA